MPSLSTSQMAFVYSKGGIIIKLSNLKILLILILALGLISYYFLRIHKPINANDVESVNIWGNTSGVTTSVEKQDIVKWFNSITNIRNNKDFAGTTPNAGVIIKLKTGDEIFIINSGSDFEVQRNNIFGKRISYWGKQPNIRNIFYGR